ncbi:MAG TPA: gephyrin-like molybdotransferase Glp [Acidobacteriaceae bacterium]|nr:gephyrin-like molybdotransferase Glp [Acidobacteriaceae bacterium]
MNGRPARVIDFSEALAVVVREAANVRLPKSERVALLASVGRVLAEPIAADRDQPPFDRATRDGFAVRAEEWSARKKLRVVGQVRAGEIWNDAAIASDEAVEIMTGAPVPSGADAVAMVEHAEQSGSEVKAAAGRILRVGENVVPRGSEARAGDVVLQPGVAIGAAEIALAAMCGCSQIAIYMQPRVAIVATGDELVEIDDKPAPHQIRNSNSYALAAFVGAVGGDARRLPIAPDTREDLRARIAEARDADLLLLSGGVSAGKYDLVEDVLAEFGAEFFFTGVKMQPGKPVVFGRTPKAGCPTSRRDVGDAAHNRPGGDEWLYLFGLPGNPVSTEVTFRCFAEPLLRALCGTETDSIAPKFVQAILAEEIRAKSGLTRLLPARLMHSFERLEVRLVSWQGSGDLAANARANCYAVLPDGRDLHAGEVVTVLLR